MSKVMYMGPTVPGIARKDTIFDGVLPEKVEERRKNDIHFSRLLVPMDKALRARQQLEEEGSVLAVAFSNVEKNMERQEGVENE